VFGEFAGLHLDLYEYEFTFAVLILIDAFSPR
jgi:hypothetical protein